MHNVLIVGGGSIGERHLRCFLATGRVTVSLCESRKERLSDLAAKYPLTGSFENIEAVALSEFSAAVICVPAPLHIPLARRFAEAGLHLLIEKPLAISLDGVEELSRVVDEKRLVVGVAHVARARRVSRAVKELADSGVIGPVRSAVLMSGYDHRQARPDYRETYFARRETGGGVIQDALPHSVNLVQWLMGPVASVMAAYDHLEIEDIEADDTASLLLRFRDNGAMGNLHCNAWQACRSNTISLAGPEGNILGDVTQSRVGMFLRKRQEWTWTDIPREQPDAKGQLDEPFVVQANNFLDAIAGRGRLLCTLAEAQHTVEVCMAALESGRRRQTVDILVKSAVGGRDA